jgi:hypothetical protein
VVEEVTAESAEGISYASAEPGTQVICGVNPLPDADTAWTGVGLLPCPNPSANPVGGEEEGTPALATRKTGSGSTLLTETRWRTRGLVVGTVVVLILSLIWSGSAMAATGWWESNQSAVPIGDPGCSSSNGTATAVALRKEWDYWDSCGGAEVSAAAEGLPAGPWGGDHVFRWRKPAGDSNVYQKLNRTFTKDNWTSGSPGPTPNTGSPANVSGVYTVWQYLPSARFRLNPRHGWVYLSEFKENYNDSGGAWLQGPTWGLGCNNFSGATMCTLTPNSSAKFGLSSYMDRWVKWEYRVYQGAKDTTGHGGRIELWADDKLLDTGYESRQHVGSAAFSPLSRTRSWVWIVGQYTSNQTTNGVPDYQGTDATSYLGRSSVAPIP